MDALPSIIPANARVREWCRREQALLHKICRTYSWQQPDTLQDAAHASAFIEGTAYLFDLPSWHERRDACMTCSGVQESADAIDRYAATILMRYADAFSLHRKIQVTILALKDDPAPHPRFGDFFQQAGEKLADLYINTITRRTHAELKALGFTDRDAFSLQGYLVRKTSFYCKREDPSYYSPEVYPKREGPRGKNTDIAFALGRLDEYGERHVKNPLEAGYAEWVRNNPPSNGTSLS
jgi:hypothetical protein